MAKAKKNKNTKAESQNTKTGGIYFSNEINCQIKIDANADEGKKLVSCVNLFDGQILGDAGVGKNAIIKQMAQTVNEDFNIEFEVELTEDEAEFARHTTKRAIIFLCRDVNNVPCILTPGRRQVSYCYYITTEPAFLCVRTNSSGTDTMSVLYKNDAEQSCTASMVDNKIKVSLINTASSPLTKMGYVKLPDGYTWDVKVIAF